ncbi:MAG: hypothetical protein QOF89_5429 [Acidobacteriota bacterium]|jgi:hypothetical protein|nr:hypothetical protein [Acidobacteriota bacterium]
MDQELISYFEDVRGEVRLLARGLIELYEKLESSQLGTANELATLQSAMRRSFEAVENRLQLVENWKDKTTRDAIALIRDKYKRPAQPPPGDESPS